MDFLPTKLAGLYVIEPRSFPDERGFFVESYNRLEFERHGICNEFVQDNHSYSTHGVIRGLHFQIPPYAQSKLVRVVDGKVWDVVVDLRRGSESYGEWEAIELSAENQRMLYVPHGFAHAFCVLSKSAHFLYKCDNYYAPEHQGGIRWDDPDLNIPWPVGIPNISEKDRVLPTFSELPHIFD